MKFYDSEPGFGPLPYPRHYYIFDKANLSPVTDGGGDMPVKMRYFDHGEEGFKAAKSELEIRQSAVGKIKKRFSDKVGNSLPNYELRFVFDGDDAVIPGSLDTHFGRHGEDNPSVGDNVVHSIEDLQSQAADYRRVVEYNNSNSKK